MKNIITILALFLISFISLAADIPSINRLFEKEFFSGYTEGKCEKNIEGFIKKASELGIDLKGVIILEINQSGSIWVYHARQKNTPPASLMWFHHYVAVISQDDWELNQGDLVIDFDFGNTPRLVPIREYLEKMLMTNDLWGNLDRVNRDFAMGLTNFTGVKAEAYIKAVNPAEQEVTGIFENLKMRALYARLLN